MACRVGGANLVYATAVALAGSSHTDMPTDTVSMCTHFPTYPHTILWPAPYSEVKEEVVVHFITLLRRVADQFHQLLHCIQ